MGAASVAWQQSLPRYKAMSNKVWLTPPIYLFWRRYNILGASIVAKAKSDKTAAKGLFELIGLEPEKYRLGHTKASPTHTF